MGYLMLIRTLKLGDVPSFRWSIDVELNQLNLLIGPNAVFYLKLCGK
jgi:hypothetical protein